MAHILAKLKGVKLEDIKKLLKEHAPVHAEDGMYLEHLWKNADDSNEVLFLFKVDNLNHAKEVIKKTHSKALKEDPNANLPHMTYLE